MFLDHYNDLSCITLFSNAGFFTSVANGEDAALLNAQADAPGLEDGLPIELAFSVMRGDRYKIVLNLSELSR